MTMSLLSSKKSAVFVCSHHSGHLNPILSLVPIFHKHGWDVHFFCFPQKQSKLEKIPGLKFHRAHSTFESLQEAVLAAIQDRFQLPMTENIQGEFFFEQILPATVEILDDGFAERIQNLDPQVMVCDVSALWGILTAKILQIPVITSCSCTLFEPTCMEGVFGFLRNLPVSKQSIQWIQEHYDIDYDPLYSYMNESSFLISWSLPHFQPLCRQDDPKVHFFGAALSATILDDLKDMAASDRSPGPECSVVSFIEQERGKNPSVKIVYCTLGTVVGQEPWTLVGKRDGDMVKDFYEEVIKTLGSGPEYSVILSIGTNRTMKDLPELPSNFFVRNFVPQLVVLNMADVFITHCGNNGVHEAFFFGCPMLCVPVFGDQHPNADMIEKIGAGVQIRCPFAPAPSPNLDHVTSEKLHAKLKEIIVDREEQIRSSTRYIQKLMLQQHVAYHTKGYIKIENFIKSHHPR